MTGDATTPRLRYLLGVALVALLGVARLAPTYTTFNQTVDEPAHIAWVAIKYFGTASLDTAGLPRHTLLTPDADVTGYVAISLHHLVMEHARYGRYEWLRRRRPLERIGQSILLFRIDD